MTASDRVAHCMPAAIPAIGQQAREGSVNLLGTHTVWQSCRMDTSTAATRYTIHRFPAEIINHAVWLYLRFCLKCRDFEELL